MICEKKEKKRGEGEVLGSVKNDLDIFVIVRIRGEHIKR